MKFFRVIFLSVGIALLLGSLGVHLDWWGSLGVGFLCVSVVESIELVAGVER